MSVVHAELYVALTRAGVPAARAETITRIDSMDERQLKTCDLLAGVVEALINLTETRRGKDTNG